VVVAVFVFVFDLLRSENNDREDDCLLERNSRGEWQTHPEHRVREIVVFWVRSKAIP